MIEHSREWWRDELKWGVRHPWQFAMSWTWPIRHPGQWLMAQHYRYTVGSKYPLPRKMPWYVSEFAAWQDRRWQKYND